MMSKEGIIGNLTEQTDRRLATQEKRRAKQERMTQRNAVASKLVDHVNGLFGEEGYGEEQLLRLGKKGRAQLCESLGLDPSTDLSRLRFVMAKADGAHRSIAGKNYAEFGILWQIPRKNPGKPDRLEPFLEFGALQFREGSYDTKGTGLRYIHGGEGLSGDIVGHDLPRHITADSEEYPFIEAVSDAFIAHGKVVPMEASLR